MRWAWRWGGVVSGLLCAVCSCSRDPRVDELLEQLRGTQSQQAEFGQVSARTEVLRGDVREAFAPLREALAGLTRDQVEVRTQFADVSGEMGEVLGVVKSSVDEASRGRLQQLQDRLAKLEIEMRQRAEAAQEEQALILRALELTADKLDGFLQRVQQLGPPGDADNDSKTGVPPRKNEGDSGPGQQESSLAVGWWWGVVGVLSALLGVWLVRRRRPLAAPAPMDPRAEPSIDWGVEPVDVPIELPIDVLAEPATERPSAGSLHAVQPLRGAIPGTPTLEAPIGRVLELEHPRPGAVVEVAERWLVDDPRVLAVPEPEVLAERDRLSLRYWLAPDLPAGEAARVETEVSGVLAGRDLWGATEDTDSKVLAGNAFRQGKA